MKRCWIGAVFLLVLLVVSLSASWAMEEIHEPIEENLNRAAKAALQEDWGLADRFFGEAWETWEKWEHFRSCLADHTPVEEISAGFRSTQIYAAQREKTDFAAHCRELARKTAAVGEAHSLGWWNML